MSPRFYWFLWIVYGVSAAIIWLGGVFTMLAAVIFGFAAFGLVFVGMMCVLPSVVSHPAAPRVKNTRAVRDLKPVSPAPAAAEAFTYRSA